MNNGIWWTSLWPGVAIVVVVLGLTLLGESLNDLADPRLRSRRRIQVASTPEQEDSVGGLAESTDSISTGGQKGKNDA